jgi:hypothetical protein
MQGRIQTAPQYMDMHISVHLTYRKTPLLLVNKILGSSFGKYFLGITKTFTIKRKT